MSVYELWKVEREALEELLQKRRGIVAGFVDAYFEKIADGTERDRLGVEKNYLDAKGLLEGMPVLIAEAQRREIAAFFDDLRAREADLVAQLDAAREEMRRFNALVFQPAKQRAEYLNPDALANRGSGRPVDPDWPAAKAAYQDAQTRALALDADADAIRQEMDAMKSDFFAATGLDDITGLYLNNPLWCQGIIDRVASAAHERALSQIGG